MTGEPIAGHLISVSLRLILKPFLVCLAVFGALTRLCAAEPELTQLAQGLSHPKVQKRIESQQALSRRLLIDRELSADQVFALYQGLGDPESKMRVLDVLKQVVLLEHHGAVGQGYLGIVMNAVQTRLEAGQPVFAIEISQVQEGSPAANAGLLVGDLILNVDGEPLVGGEPTEKFRDIVTSKLPGDEVAFNVSRDGIDLQFRLNLGRFPANNQGGRQFRKRIGHLEIEQSEEDVFFQQWLADRLKSVKTKEAVE